MPIRKGYGTKRRRVRRRKGRRRQRRSALADKKINTLIERRMQEIAKREDNKARRNLILREYWFATGMNRYHNVYGAGEQIYYDGIVTKIATIDKMDVNMPLNAPEAVNPYLFDNGDGDGSTQGMFTETIQGRRTTDTVKITGFSLGIKALFPAVQVLMQDHQIIGGLDPAAEVPPDQPPNVPRQIETVVLKYAIVGVLRQENIEAQAQQVDPLPQDLLPYHTWGYSPLLDDSERTNTLWTKKRLFLKGDMSANVTAVRNKDKTQQLFVRLKEPLSVKYLAADQNGHQSHDWCFYLVLRSNVPAVTGNQTIDFSAFAPKVTAFTKTHYFE